MSCPRINCPDCNSKCVVRLDVWEFQNQSFPGNVCTKCGMPAGHKCKGYKAFKKWVDKWQQLQERAYV